MLWERHNDADMEQLGMIPQFLSPYDDRPAREQFNANYIGGWLPMKGFLFVPSSKQLVYPAKEEYDTDEVYEPLFETELHGEQIVVYDYAWVMVRNLKTNEIEVSRMD